MAGCGIYVKTSNVFFHLEVGETWKHEFILAEKKAQINYTNVTSQGTATTSSIMGKKGEGM